MTLIACDNPRLGDTSSVFLRKAVRGGHDQKTILFNA